MTIYACISLLISVTTDSKSEELQKTKSEVDRLQRTLKVQEENLGIHAYFIAFFTNM